MINLVVDIGNTLAKAAVVDGAKVVATYSGEHLEDLPLKSIAQEFGVRRSILSTTRGCGEHWAAQISQCIGHCMLLRGDTPVPLRVEYSQRQLGCDRLAAAVGAAVSYPGRELMIVDFGTAITIDFVTGDGIFEGGFISPGLTTRLRSLHDYTATLPLCEAHTSFSPIAKSTQDAIVGGVVKGIIFEIEGYIREQSEKKCELLVIFSGGDSFFFDKQIKNTIFADREILFKGLSTILDYNV